MEVTLNKKITPEFVMECAKIGRVQIFSHQVEIQSENGTINMKELRLPEGCSIERISAISIGQSYKVVASVIFSFLQ